MSVLVVNCNHWIGFHIVNELLEYQYEVDGIIDKNSADDLTMFFGRNSLFSFVNERERKKYSTCIIIGDKTMDTIEAKRTLMINPYDTIIKSRDKEIIRTEAMLFGEWMPMNEKGFFHKNKLISFDSKEFKERAIYIQDFILAMFQWIESTKLPCNMEIKSYGNHQGKSNSISIRSREPLTKRKKQVLDHYKRYKNFYIQN